MAIHHSLFSRLFHELPKKGCELCGECPRAVYCANPNLWQGVFRGFLGAGEAICFGLDSIAVPYIKEAGVIFTFYTTGILIFAYLAAFHIKDTKYFTHEEGVVIPKHIMEAHAHAYDAAVVGTEKQDTSFGTDQEKVEAPPSDVSIA